MTDLPDRASLELGTATLSDALDRLGIPGQCRGIRAQSNFACAGPAFTVRYLPDPMGRGTVGDYIDDVAAGAVIVLDNNGRMDATVWGGLLTRVARRRGIAGVIIDGVHRDSADIRQLQLPLFSRGAYMRTGKDRVTAVAFNTAVCIGEVRVEQDDHVVGDGDGVVVLPRERVEEILALAREIHAAETRIADAVSKGQRLDRARRQQGYFKLQRHARTTTE